MSVIVDMGPELDEHVSILTTNLDSMVHMTSTPAFAGFLTEASVDRNTLNENVSRFACLITR